jgi:thymidine phosphorylase
MKDPESARELAIACTALGNSARRITAALITDMSQPLSDMIGNAIEVREVIEVLGGERPGRFRDLCIELSAHLASLARVSDSVEDGRTRARRALDTGAALARFGRFVEAQGGDARVIQDTSLLPAADVIREVRAARSGSLAEVDTEAVGNTAGALGAGRRRKDDTIDAAVGLELISKLGHRFDEGDLLARIYARSEADAEAAERRLQQALKWSEHEQREPPLVYDVVQPALKVS